jgi:hypothetical protein
VSNGPPIPVNSVAPDLASQGARTEGRSAARALPAARILHIGREDIPNIRVAWQQF